MLWPYFFIKNKHYLLQGDIYTMDISSGKTIYIYMCIWGVKEVEVEGRRNRSVKSSSELGKKSASESESEGRGQWCKNLCFHALDTEHHTELLGTSPLWALFSLRRASGGMCVGKGESWVYRRRIRTEKKTKVVTLGRIIDSIPCRARYFALYCRLICRKGWMHHIPQIVRVQFILFFTSFCCKIASAARN